VSGFVGIAKSVRAFPHGVIQCRRVAPWHLRHGCWRFWNRV